MLRDALPHRRFELNLGGGNFKAQFRRADRSRAALALIIGEDELARGVVALKPLRLEAGQSECPMARAAGPDRGGAAGVGYAGVGWVDEYLSEQEQLDRLTGVAARQYPLDCHRPGLSAA